MKLRLQADSIRVRLSEEEVQRLGREGCLHETIALSSSQALGCRLELAPVHLPYASLEESALRIRIPHAAARTWISSSEITLPAPDCLPGTARILVERDVEPAHRRRK